MVFEFNLGKAEHYTRDHAADGASQIDLLSDRNNADPLGRTSRRER